MNVYFDLKKSRRLLGLLAVVVSVAGLAPIAAVQAQTPSQYLPIVANDRIDCPALRTATKFGVQTYGPTGKNDPYYQEMVDAGGNWLRVEAYWAGAEPTNTTPPTFDWTGIDQSVRAVGDACMNINLTVVSNPSWAATFPEGPIDKAPYSKFAEFMAALVERYDGDGIDDAPGHPVVRNFELYNEPDGGNFPGVYHWGNAGDKYAAMLKAVYPAMKAASPLANLVFGGVSYDNFKGEEAAGTFIREFVPTVLQNGGGDYFDIFNFHAYPLFAEKWTNDATGASGVGLLQKTAYLRSLLAQYGVANKPVVVTEAGWHSNADQPPASTETQQAIYVVMLFMQAYAANVDYLSWFMLWDVGGYYPFANGLVTNQAVQNPPRRKLAFGAYQVLTREIAPLRFVGRSTDPAKDGGLEMYQFHDDGQQRSVYAAWHNPIGTPGANTASFPASQVTVHDMQWSARIVKDKDDGKADGVVHVTVPSTPIYIEVSDN